MTTVYDASYFEWQRVIGAFGGKANLFKFAAHVKPSDVVLDFGCGGGFLLKNLICRQRIGVEINPVAAEVASQNGVECHPTLTSILDDSIDVVVSNHALEHVPCPLNTLRELYSKIVSGGLLIVVVPCEATTFPFNSNDQNKHIYTWNPQLLGNIAMQAGFTVEDVFPIWHKWPLNFIKLQEITGWRIFHFLCLLKGNINRRNFQVKLVARKPFP